MAQTAAGAKDQAPSDAARRAAESPYRFILQNAAIRERPKPKPESAAVEREPARRPAPEAVAAVPQRPAPQAAPAVAQPAPAAPEPVATPVAVAAPQASPAPVVAARKELVPVRQDPPVLGALLMRERPSGRVTVAFDVMPDGSVSDVKVVSSSNSSLNRPSVNAISAWKFQPIDDTRHLEIELNYSN